MKKVERQKLPLVEALDLVKGSCKAKFDSTIEVHINLNLDVKKQDQQIRYVTTLPNGTGKTKKVAVFTNKTVSNADLVLTEDMVDDIVKGKLQPKIDFDMIVAEPAMMGKLAKAARILGPAGVMPNPKTGTVTEDVEKAVEQIKKGRIEIKTEQNAPLIHTIIGKKSFETKKLEENFLEVINTLKQNKPSKAKGGWVKAIILSATMGSSVEVELGDLIA